MRRQRGMALILALLLVAFAAMTALTLASRARDVAMDAARDRTGAVARAAAQGGVERARWALARDPNYRGETVTIGASSVTVTVGVGGAPGADGSRAVTVTVIAHAPAPPFADSMTARVIAELRRRRDQLPAIVTWRE